MKRLQEVFAVGIRETWIVEIYFGNPGYATEKNVLEAGLGCGGHGNGVAITAKAGGNPQHVDFGEWYGVTLGRLARHSGDSGGERCRGDVLPAANAFADSGCCELSRAEL
jgi:hypothetical protein